jgi:transglutaminase-like putative cysteine protease
MRIRVLHETKLCFPTPPRTLHLHLRLTPRSFDAQYVLRWRVQTDLMATLRPREDAYGSVVYGLTWHKRVEAVTVTASGEVETTDRVGVVRGAVETLPEEMFLRASPLAQANPALREFALRVPGADPLDRLHRLMEAVRAHLTFEGGFGGEAPAGEIYALAKGGAADFAHVFVACARAWGVPARLVTGYRLGEAGEEGAEMFAWAEAFTTGLGWIAFDAVNDLCADDTYVRVAAGLDARDAAPVRVWTPAGDATTTARLVVEQAAAQSQN